MSQLPLYHRNDRVSGANRRGEFRFGEAHLLMFLFLTFSLAWFVLVLYMPDAQTLDTGFEATYNKFHRKSPNGLKPLSFPKEDDDRNPSFTHHDQDSDNPRPPLVTVDTESKGNPPQSLTDPPAVIVTNDEDNGEYNTAQERQAKVRDMIKHAWDGYVKFAFGENELKPMSKKGHSAAIFGKTKLGATLVDSLDTLYITGLLTEFDQAKKWVEESFNINEIDSAVSFFEFNIRFIGGFLSAYALSGEEVFKYKAVSLADKLMPVFNADTGLPSSFINMKTGASRNWGWAKTSSILSEIGTLHLEYQYLTELSGNPIYLEKVQKVREILKDIPKPDGIYFTLINQKSLRFGNKVSSLGALGDSFYEYLLKSWLITSKEDKEARDMYYTAIDAVEKKILVPKSDGVLLVTDYKNSRSDQTMQHLACFSGGMYALGSVHAENGRAAQYMSIAKNITNACRQSYDTSATKLGPERFRVNEKGLFSSRGNNDKLYLLRPETVESYFYLWRLTKDQKYREWGWDVVQALEKHCKTANGYSGIKDVYKDPPVKDDVQQSFFIAETLKYLYLLFSDDSILPLDKWVFNTEAHPLPVLRGIPDAGHHTSELHQIN